VGHGASLQLRARQIVRPTGRKALRRYDFRVTWPQLRGAEPHYRHDVLRGAKPHRRYDFRVIRPAGHKATLQVRLRASCGAQATRQVRFLVMRPAGLKPRFRYDFVRPAVHKPLVRYNFGSCVLWGTLPRSRYDFVRPAGHKPLIRYDFRSCVLRGSSHASGTTSGCVLRGTSHSSGTTSCVLRGTSHSSGTISGHASCGAQATLPVRLRDASCEVQATRQVRLRASCGAQATRQVRLRVMRPAGHKPLIRYDFSVSHACVSRYTLYGHVWALQGFRRRLLASHRRSTWAPQIWSYGLQGTKPRCRYDFSLRLLALWRELVTMGHEDEYNRAHVEVGLGRHYRRNPDLFRIARVRWSWWERQVERRSGGREGE
jgi:hypothetical protein